MFKNFIFAFLSVFIIVGSVFAAEWVQLADKIYLDASSLSPYSYNLNFDKDEIYSVWSKILNNGNDWWKDLEKFIGKKIWYQKSLWVVNCTKKEYTIKSSIDYDLKENVVSSYDSSYLKWDSVVPETLGEEIYLFVCSSR